MIPSARPGIFFTAQQMQPVFGNLIAARVRSLFRQMGSPPDFTIVELRPGRGEMAQAFSEWRYVPVEIGSQVPDRVRGVFFSNEFFDALPVEAVLFSRGEFRSNFSALAARGEECGMRTDRLETLAQASWPSGKRNLPGLWRPRRAPKSGEGGCN
jgi:SAM-dependent MidA family methyltransferase